MCTCPVPIDAAALLHQEDCSAGERERGLGGPAVAAEVEAVAVRLRFCADGRGRVAGAFAEEGNATYISSFALIFLRTFRLKSRGPPKKRVSDCVIGMPFSKRSSIRCKVQTKSAS